MFSSGEVDLAVIATPHRDHAALATQALQAGLHTVCDKPLTVSVAEADRLLEAASASKGMLTCISQSRFEPIFRRAKEILGSGELGSFVRCEIEESFWRSHAYYRSANWRGTWNGEAGGVSINQGPHLLDRYLWLCGRPEQVTGFCDTALHPIEVEDTASALFRHSNGRHGHLHINTTECPQSSRLMISCDRGRITIEGGTLRVDRLANSIKEATASVADSFGDIPCETTIEEIGLIVSPEILLSRYYENVARAIAGREAISVSPQEAAQAVELANAIVLSSHARESITLPLDRDRYSAFLESRMAESSSKPAEHPTSL